MELYPENSWRGLKAALDKGANWIEFDIQMYQPGQFVLLHDADFQRTANTPLPLFELTEAELQQISIHEPGRLGERFAPEPIVSLEEVLIRLGDYPSAHAMVEIKEESLDYWGLEAVMHSLLPIISRFKTQCVLISFSLDALRYSRNHSDLETGWVLRRYDAQSLILAAELNPEYLICNYTKLPPNKKPLAGEWRWMIYDITDPELALQWMKLDVDLVETRDIGRLISYLNSPTDTGH